MSRLETLLRSVGLALGEKGRRALSGDIPFSDVLLDVAKLSLDDCRKRLTTDDLRGALVDAATVDAGEYADALARALEAIGVGLKSPYRAGIEAYLGTLPVGVRVVLRRPSDPNGVTAPTSVPFYKPEDLMLFLPARPPRFHPVGEPAGLDDWELTELVGFGEYSEVWAGSDENHPEFSPAALKFATDPGVAERVVAHQDVFRQVFELTDQPGVVPLRSVFLDTDPPCLESMFVPGYDLTALMHDWRWRYDVPKPEAALKLIRRLTEVVARAHARGLVHRDLKPSNILLHQSDNGRFTLWVTDFGWGQLQALRSLERGRASLSRGEQLRLSMRGAYSTLYLAPQVTRKEDPTPQDDVHAIGVIWFQLLQRDPSAQPPTGSEWAAEFHTHGLTDSQARVLNSCVALRADKRPKNAMELMDELMKVTVAPRSPAQTDGSKLIPVKPHSSTVKLPAQPKSSAQVAPVVMSASFDPNMPGYGGLPRLVYNTLGMSFALIAPGKFMMGSPEGESGRREHEGPRREVQITKPFYLSVTPVTQAHYEAVIGKNPAQFNRNHFGGPEHPVESVAWQDAEQFCAKMALVPGELHDGRKYRLPTEAEWEYACRAGTVTPFHFGDKLTGKDAHFMAPGAFGKTGGQGRTTPVGKYPANAFGLLDMHGNVLEWVHDWYDAGYYEDGPDTNPQGPSKGKQRVVRGGCFAMFANDCRSAARRAQPPETPSNTIGFRVVLVIGS